MDEELYTGVLRNNLVARAGFEPPGLLRGYSGTMKEIMQMHTIALRTPTGWRLLQAWPRRHLGLPRTAPAS